MTDTRIASTSSPLPTPRTSWAWLLVAAFIVLLFYPGIMSNDSIASLRQARSFEFNDWHPPVMALIWSVLDRIVEPLVLRIAWGKLMLVGCRRNE